MWFQRTAKYSNQKTIYNDRVYDSKGEAGLAQELDLLVKSGQVLKVEPQVQFILYGKNGGKICTHRPDFLLTFRDGHHEVYEYKGYATEIWRLKLKLWEDNYPEIPYYVVTANERYYLKAKRSHAKRR